MSSSIANATVISRTLFRMLNQRANAEWEDSLMYSGFAQWFSHNKLPGSEAWCLKHSEGERQEALKIFNHLAHRRIEEDEATTPQGQQPLQVQEPVTSGKIFKKVSNIRFDIKGAHTADFDDPVALWKKALENEKEDSRAYFALLTKAREMKDYVTEEFVFNNFINEQFKTENILEEILENTLLVTSKGPDLYFELDRNMPNKPH